MDLNQLIIAQLDSAYGWIERAADGLTDQQLYYQPTSDTNSIAWLVWHLSRWRDAKGAAIGGRPQVWVSDGWAERFGMADDRTGLGDTTEQVASFRADRDDLLGYAGAAHRAIVECVAKLAPEQFEQPVEYMPGDLRPVWTVLIGVGERLHTACWPDQLSTRHDNRIRLALALKIPSTWMAMPNSSR